MKIAGYDYSVERPEESFVNGDDACDGLHVENEQIIKVAKTGNAAYQNTVFIHEICHAIIGNYCNNLQDEGFVEQFSKGLYQVIIDNPEIFR